MVREVDDQAALSLALIENLQRDDLSAIDTALGYQQLMGEFGIAQAEVARLVGRDRSTVSNTLRLLKLPERLQKLLRTGELSEGHARALLGVAEPARQVELASRAVAEGWSVRQTEREAQQGGAPAARPSMMKKSPEPAPASADARRVEEVLRQRLGTDVRLTAKRRGRGTLSISYYTNDDLTRVLELILGEPYQG
jgi:ParB family chromosome partitioning protein